MNIVNCDCMKGNSQYMDFGVCSKFLIFVTLKIVMCLSFLSFNIYELVRVRSLILCKFTDTRKIIERKIIETFQLILLKETRGGGTGGGFLVSQRHT